MRKVKFPFVLDATPFLSEELKKKLGPATEKLREIEKEREERSKVKKKARVARDEIEKMKKMKEDEEKKEGGSSTTTSTSTNGGGEKMEIDGEEKKDETEGLSEGSKLALGSAITEEEELKLREKEKKEFEDSINDEVRKDIGANVTALYELVGVVTHKGAAADAGHYISWVRKEGKNGEETKKGEKDEQWYKVSEMRNRKLDWFLKREKSIG